MKKILAIALILTTVSIIPVSASVEHKVIKVIDGDTVYVDFNDNGIAEQDEKVRVNGIDTFETKLNDGLNWQMQLYNLTQDEALGLGYYGKEFAKKELLNKSVKAEYTAEEKFDKNNRHLMSLYYNCNRQGKCKSYEQEVLKAGFATVYTKSNLANELKQYENLDKIKQNTKRTHKLNLVVLNHKNGKYHKTNCEYGWKSGQQELINKPSIKYAPARCCYPKEIKEKKYKPYKRVVKPDAKDGNIELYFLSPLKQKHPENSCKTSACKALLYNIDNSKESIDFAIYGIAEQDRIFKALINAQKRGVKVRWVTDLTENKENIYFDTYKLMDKIPTFATDYESAESINIPDYKYKFDFQGALMHNKFFIFDNQKVFTGSTNISSSCLTGYNANIAVLINSKEIANLYKKEFDQMYYGKFHNMKNPVSNNEDILIDEKYVSVYFSPTNKISTTQIIPLINQAKKSIYIPAFYITHNDIIDALINAHKRGIEIKIIVDETSVKGKYVNVNYIKQNGIDLKIENWAGKMHMKSIIIDDDILVIGSMNFTKQGERMNDENCIVIKNSQILNSAYKKMFFKLWNSIK